MGTLGLRVVMADYGHPNLVVLDSKAITALFTVIRNKDTPAEKYITYADRLMRLLAEEGLAHLPPVKPVTVETPCGPYQGLAVPEYSTMCAVSIMRSGDILLEGVRQVATGIAVGKLLIQRDEEDPEKKPKFFYDKMPHIKDRTVLLVDPMLATGGSAMMAIKCIMERHNVPEEQITFLNVVSCPEGIAAMAKAYPKVKIITCAVDSHLNEQKYIVPGLGDFGDRYYST